MLQKILFLAIAGALGTLARYGMVSLMEKTPTTFLPWGTLSVNLIGCFLGGLVWAITEYKFHFNGDTSAIILIGFMGAFTTFSSFILETSEFMRNAEWIRAASNVLMQNVVGALALFAGFSTGGSILQKIQEL
ncbi:MAG: CrcB family protein [candidate division Zixibacteria bacterium]|nr:CrcB family protein [candidate division Zixibacteria bacterium]